MTIAKRAITYGVSTFFFFFNESVKFTINLPYCHPSKKVVLLVTFFINKYKAKDNLKAPLEKEKKKKKKDNLKASKRYLRKFLLFIHIL